MAKIERRGNHYRIRLMVKGVPKSGTFRTKAEAAAWALEQEAEIRNPSLVHKGTVADLLKRYVKDVVPNHGGARWEEVRINLFLRDPLARVSLQQLTQDDIAAFRERRLQSVQGSSVRREMNLLGSAFEAATEPGWRWLTVNPCRGVKKPPPNKSRKRRVKPEEIEKISLAAGLADGLKADTSTQRVGLAFLFGIETAMRAGEILSLNQDTVRLEERYVVLPKTKNGDERSVPLTSRAKEILDLLPDCSFDLNADSRDTLFRRIRQKSGVANLHFHDSRSEGIWRLSKKFDIFELARVIGHRDLNSLLIYYQTTAAELAAKLD